MTKEDGVRTRVDGAPAVAGPDRLLTYYAQALQASEGRFRTLIDRTIDGVLVLRRDGTVCFVNPAAEALLGRPARALVGAMFGIPLTPGAAAEVDIIRGRDQPGVAEMRVVEIDWEGQPAYLAALRDVTDRKQAGEALRFLAEAGQRLAGSLDFATTLATVARLAVEHLADWCVLDVLEDGGTVRRLAARRDDDPGPVPPDRLQGRYPPGAGLPEVLRLERPVLHNERPAAFLGGLALAPAHAEVFQALGCRAVLAVPLVARGHTLGAITLVAAGRARGYYGPGDLALAEDLARRAALALDNARLYDEAQEAVRRRDDFLALLGHELRNPLAAIVSAAQLMGQWHTDDPVLQRTQQVIARQTKHMSRLLDDLLDISRITHGKIELRKQPVDLAAVVADAVAACRQQLDDRRHHLEVTLPPEPVRLVADPTRLGQVLMNLLNNAIKYTDPGGRLALRVAAEGDEVVLRVRDGGIGIEPEMLGRVFDPFVQLGVTLDRSQGGLGMGLTLVRGLVELHGGSVAAFSDGPGKGSEFVVRLPRGGAAAALPPEEAAGPAAPPGCRILLVEDNPDNRTMFRALLEMWGHPVDEAADGGSGLERVRAGRPDVAIVDIDLPGMNGYELAEAVCREFGEDRPFLVALTGFGMPEDRRRAQEAGFDAHLVKPVDLRELERVLARVAERRAP